jgi:hypothetical protein
MRPWPPPCVNPAIASLLQSTRPVGRVPELGSLATFARMLIPTRYKVRLSREFSYPIGAEALSEQLAGVPHFDEFQISFSDVVGAWKSKFQQMLAEGADYKIVRVRFWSPFEISVYPVQRALKHAAQEALVSHGLPQLRDWMVRQSSRTTMTFASCGIVFSPPSQMVHIQEHDHVA